MLVKKRSNLAPRFIKTLFALSVVAGVLYFFFYSSILEISAVKLEGSEMTDEIKQILGEDTVGSNIIFWRPVNDSEKTARFSTLEIRKDYINREILVKVTEREKHLIWCYEKKEACFWTDVEGVVLEESPRSIGNLIRVVEDYTDKDVVIGDYAIDAGMYKNIIGIMSAVDSLGISTMSISIQDIKRKELEIMVNGGPRIVFGINISPDFVEAAIDTFIKSGDWKRIKSINLTVYGRAYASF